MLRIDQLLIAISGACFAAYRRIARWIDGIDVLQISTEHLAELQSTAHSQAANLTTHPANTNSSLQPTNGRACTPGWEPAFVLVDVRSRAETAISTIPGAITKDQYEEERQKYRNRTVIPYCTIGGRSFLYARKLAKEGVDVMNYADSIIGWCRAGLPLHTRQGEPTNRVHVYYRFFRVPKQYEPVTS